MKGRFLILLLSVLCQFSFPQETGTDEEEKLRLIHADVLRGQKIGDQSVRQFIGDVLFRQGAATLSCDRATEYEGTGRYVLYGDVVYADTAKSLYGDKITYYESTKVAYVEGNVKLVDSTKTLTADRIRYHDEEEEAYATGNVFLADEKEFVELIGENAEYMRETGYAKVTGNNAKLVKTDSTQADTLIIFGTIFQMFDDGERFLVTDSVRVIRGEIEAFCDSLEYFQEESIIKLANSPRVHQNRQYLTGNSVSLLMEESDVKAIHIVGDAIATSTVDSTIVTPVPYDLLSGQDMMVYVTDEKIDSVLITERATSYYHVIEDGEEMGLNKALGDQLFIRFVNDTLSQVKVKSSPSASVGQFHPPGHRSELESELTGELNKMGIVIEEPPAAVVASPDSSDDKTLLPADEE